MGEGKWTPGPWRECKAGECSCGIIWSIPGDFPVCTAAGGSTFPIAVAHEHMADAPDQIYQSITPTACEANARLIAAAPEMAEALEAVLEACGSRSDGFVKMAADALARARGDQNV